MVLGNAGRKLGTMIELAEDLYEKVSELKEQLSAMRDTVEETNDRVEALEAELAEQRALLQAIAEAQGVTADEVEAETDGGRTGPAGDEATAATDADR